jgi:hypothetical protein
MLLCIEVRRRESGILPVTVEKAISSSKGEFLPHATSFSTGSAAILSDDDTKKYKNKLSMSRL